jgi:hypothetical protein
MRKLSLICLLLGLVAMNSCSKKADPRPDTVNVEPQRDPITYKMTVVTNAENKFPGDTLIVKVNGTTYVNQRGSVGDSYGTLFFPLVKTGDVINVYYNPGKVVFNGMSMIDENGLEIYLDHENNNMLLKAFRCRCIGVYETKLK